MNHRRATLVVIAVAAFAAAVAGCAQSRALTEAWLLEYASTPYDKGEHAFSRQVLGTLNEVDVVAEFPCSDVCPDYTVRIIHFDVGPGAGCTAIGGVERTVVVPIAIAAMQKAFCFPSVLAQNWNAVVR